MAISLAASSSSLKSADGCILPDSKGATLKKFPTSVRCLSVCLSVALTTIISGPLLSDRGHGQVFTCWTILCLSLPKHRAHWPCVKCFSMSGYSTARCSIGQIVCECLCFFFPLVLVKGVGKTWQKHLLEMTASREAVLLLMEEAKRNGCTFERFLKWVDCKIGKIQGKSCHLRLLRWPSTLQMQKHMKDVHSANAGPHLELQGQVIFLT